MSAAISYGWVCPRCEKVNAPWRETCDCVAGVKPAPAPYYPAPTYVPDWTWRPWPWYPPYTITLCSTTASSDGQLI